MKLNFNPRLKVQLTMALAVLLAWLGIVCAIPQATHACCKDNSNSVHRKMPCCIVQPVAITADQAPSGLSSPQLDMDSPPGISHFDTSPLFSSSQQSVLASEWYPDQSKRYLELRVLLN